LYTSNCSTCRGIAEIVNNNINGFHIDYRDTNALTGIISQLSNDKVFYDKYNKAAFQHSQNFSISKMQSTIIDVVERQKKHGIRAKYTNIPN